MTDYTDEFSRTHFNDAGQFELCVCPLCHRVGKRVNSFENTHFKSNVIHVIEKTPKWENQVVDSCSPATDTDGNAIKTEPEYYKLVNHEPTN